MDDGTPGKKPPAPSASERAGPSPVTLVTALHAAETLMTFHLQQVVHTAGKRQVYHLEMAERCDADIEDIKQRLAAPTGPDGRPPPSTWTPPQQPRKTDW
jgi:hypothetical protein